MSRNRNIKKLKVWVVLEHAQILRKEDYFIISNTAKIHGVYSEKKLASTHVVSLLEDRNRGYISVLKMAVRGSKTKILFDGKKTRVTVS